MANFSTWLITIFMVMFWLFRAIVALCTQFSIDFLGIIAYDFNWEVIIAFVTLLCIVLVVKRKMIGAILYVVTYGYYFGGYIYINVLPIIINQNQMDATILQNATVSIIAIILSICSLWDLSIEKIKRKKYRDSKTDWFFDNKKTDRNLDNKADKNQYRIY